MHARLGGVALAIVVTILWFIVFYAHRQYFSGVFVQRAVYQRSQIRRTQDTGQLQGAKLDERPANTHPQVPESVTKQTTRLLDN